MALKAIVVILLMSGKMIMVSDTRGPYQTEAECKDRIIEMVEAVARLRPIAAYQGKCEEVPAT